MKFNNEKQSIDYFTERLERSGFTQIVATQVEDEFCHYDIRAIWKGDAYRFELKRRNKKLFWYSDTIIEESKYNELTSYTNGGSVKACYLVTLFDDYFTINNINNPHTKVQIWAEQTTEFNRKKKVLKDCVCYKLESKNKYSYE